MDGERGSGWSVEALTSNLRGNEDRGDRWAEKRVVYGKERG